MIIAKITEISTINALMDNCIETHAEFLELDVNGKLEFLKGMFQCQNKLDKIKELFKHYCLD